MLMVRNLAFLTAVMCGAYALAGGYFSAGDVLDLPSALLAFAAGTAALVIAVWNI